MIAALIVVILALSSLIYKYHTTAVKTLSVTYPVEVEKSDNSPKLYLYVFFSKKNCSDCLEIIEVLNVLPSSTFVVRGVVPDSEIKNINDIRDITGATFSIESDVKFNKLIP